MPPLTADYVADAVAYDKRRPVLPLTRDEVIERLSFVA
jgi:hypothetical protein